MKIGDVILVRGSSWLAHGILAATGNTVSHVGLVISVDPPICIEALTRVKTNLLAVTIGNVEKAYVGSDPTLSDVERNAIVAKALTLSSASYGWTELALQLADAAFHSTWPTDHLSFELRKHPICSFLVATAYACVGRSFDKESQSVTPADCYAWFKAHGGLTEIK
jgi:hypothetical protein